MHFFFKNQIFDMQKEDKEIGLLMKYGFQKQSFSIGLSGIQVYRSFFRPV